MSTNFTNRKWIRAKSAPRNGIFRVQEGTVFDQVDFVIYLSDMLIFNAMGNVISNAKDTVVMKNAKVRLKEKIYFRKSCCFLVGNCLKFSLFGEFFSIYLTIYSNRGNLERSRLYSRIKWMFSRSLYLMKRFDFTKEFYISYYFDTPLMLVKVGATRVMKQWVKQFVLLLRTLMEYSVSVLLKNKVGYELVSIYRRKFGLWCTQDTSSVSI